MEKAKKEKEKKAKKAAAPEHPKLKKIVKKEEKKVLKPKAAVVRLTPHAKVKPVEEKLVKTKVLPKEKEIHKPAAVLEPHHAAAPAVAAQAPAEKKPIHKPKAAPEALHKPEVLHKEIKKELHPREEAKKPEAKAAPAAVTQKPHVAAAVPKPPVAAPVPKPPVAAPVPKAAAPVVLKELILDFPITVKDLSVKLQEKASVVIKTLMDMGLMAGINQPLSEETVRKVCAKFGFEPLAAPGEEEAALSIHSTADSKETLKPRPPIVTFMGHVDHGKTSLLDAIRKSKVVDSEFGGITQHIGAYTVVTPKGKITFLDTPGHEAFTAMRARGAKATDIVVLVVAADDGIMPQTQEAIDHARAAGVSIIVAINKIDKAQADVDRVKKQLSGVGLAAEDWGGKTITVPVSAKTGQGIEGLLEMILLEAEILELKANPDRIARGVVLEGKMVKQKGPVSTLLVQNGTLRLNSSILVGNYYGKIRALFNDRHQPVTEAGPSTPVEVLGITGIPEAGDQFFAIEDEKTAKDLVLARQEKLRQKQIQPVKRMGLEDLYSQIKAGKIRELKIVLKADAQGSIEAIKEALGKINSEEVKLTTIHEGIGNINSSDVILAIASDALILGFNVTTDDLAKAMSEKEGQDIRIYNIIYELINEIKAALEGLLAPKLKRIFLGKAEIRKVFKLSSSGIIAGCYVTKGKIMRNNTVTLLRNGEAVFEGEMSSLKRFKDDVREVEEGYECGISLKGFTDIMEGDVIEAYQIQKIARTLE